MEERAPWTSSATRRTATYSVVVQTALPEVSARLTSTNATKTRVNLEGLVETLLAAIFANAKQGIYLYIAQVEQNSCQDSVMNYLTIRSEMLSKGGGRMSLLVVYSRMPNPSPILFWKYLSHIDLRFKIYCLNKNVFSAHPLHAFREQSSVSYVQ